MASTSIPRASVPHLSVPPSKHSPSPAISASIPMSEAAALVEALATGRNAVGVDISALAGFVARVKSTVHSEAELNRLEAWAKRLPKVVDIHKSSVSFGDYAELGYYKHLDHPLRWRLRKAIEQSMTESAIRLGTPRLEAFGRCVALRTAQWALDGRSKHTTVDEFRGFLAATAAEMVKGARELRAAVKSSGRRSRIEVINRSAAGMEDDERIREWSAPKLVFTSPPYPGVHVLYHRWQVDGRKEAPLPFMIANKLDGAGSSYYHGRPQISRTQDVFRQHPRDDVVRRGTRRQAHDRGADGRLL